MLLPHASRIARTLIVSTLLAAPPSALLSQSAPSTTRSQHPADLARATSLARINSLIDAQDFAQAEAAATAEYRQHPHSSVLEAKLGELALARGDFASGEGWYRRAVNDSRGQTSPMLTLARLYLEHPGSFQNAEERANALYSGALRIDPHSAEANAELALIEYRHAEWTSAANHAQAVQGDAATTPFVRSLRCGTAAALHTSQAADTACSLLTQDPRTGEDDALLAIPGLRAGERPDLIQHLFLAVGTRQRLSIAGLRWLGLAEDALGDSVSARTTLEQAYEAAPGDASLLVQLATVAQRQNKGQDALGYLAHARELAPHDASIHTMFARQCVSLGLLGEARNAMQAALAIDPDNPDGNLLMGKVTALSQDPLSARPFLLKYHALRPDDPNGTLLLGLIEYRAKEFELARPWLLQAGRQPATAAEANLYLGSSARQLGDLDQARALLERSASLNDADPEVHAELGLLALQQHDLSTAGTQLDRSLALDRDNYTANYGLLQLYAQTRDPRRPDQLKRFEALKAQTDDLNQQAMRVVEVRRTPPQQAASPVANPIAPGSR